MPPSQSGPFKCFVTVTYYWKISNYFLYTSFKADCLNKGIFYKVLEHSTNQLFASVKPVHYQRTVNAMT